MAPGFHSDTLQGFFTFYFHALKRKFPQNNFNYSITASIKIARLSKILEAPSLLCALRLQSQPAISLDTCHLAEIHPNGRFFPFDHSMRYDAHGCKPTSLPFSCNHNKDLHATHLTECLIVSVVADTSVVLPSIALSVPSSIISSAFGGCACICQCFQHGSAKEPDKVPWTRYFETYPAPFDERTPAVILGRIHFLAQVDVTTDFFQIDTVRPGVGFGYAGITHCLRFVRIFFRPIPLLHG